MSEQDTEDTVELLEDTLDSEHPNWVAIKPGLFVRKSDFEKKQYYLKRIEASNKYMHELKNGSKEKKE